MAYVNSSAPFDSRRIDFFKPTVEADLNIYSDGNFNGVTYATVMSYAKRPDFHLTFELAGTGLTSAGEGFLPAAGTVNAIYSWSYDTGTDTWSTRFYISDISLAGTDMATVMATSATADDATLVLQLFSGADTFVLSSKADYADGRQGDDTIRGNGGDDTLLGGSGADSLTGGTGRDRFVGGTDPDILASTADRAVDTFVFDRASGKDRITGFEDGFDKIAITTGAERMSDLRILDRGADVLVKFGTVEITVTNIEPGQLTKADFLFL